MLNKKDIKYSLINLLCCGLLSLGLLHDIQAKVISQEEKDFVVAQLQDHIGKNVTFISPNPQFHKMEDVAAHVGTTWEKAKQDLVPRVSPHSIMGRNNEFLWKAAAQTNSREEFIWRVTTILRSICSHFWFEDAHQEIENIIRNFPNLGICFEKKATDDSIQPYVITYVAKGSYADQQGVRSNDVFYFSNPQRALFQQKTSSKGEHKEKLTLEIYRDGNFLKDLTLHSFPEKVAEINEYISNYQINLEYLDDLQNQCCLFPPAYICIPIKSFDGFYPGSEIASIFKLLETIPEQRNLIIDLRNNPGGHISNLKHLLSYFMEPEQPYGASVTRDAWDTFCETNAYKYHVAQEDSQKQFLGRGPYKDLFEYIRDHHPKLIDYVPKNKDTQSRHRFGGNVAIFVNKNTVSCAETFTATLKNLLKERCIVIGGKTPGCTLIKHYPHYISGFKLHYPERDYITSEGFHMEGNGIQPDVIIEDSRDTKSHLEEALAWFSL